MAHGKTNVSTRELGTAAALICGAAFGAAVLRRAAVRLLTTRAALGRAEERFRLLMENVRDYSIFMLDPQGRIVDWNVGAESITGFHERDVIGQPFAMLFTAADREARVPQLELEKARRGRHAPDIRWHERKNGDRYWADGFTTALYDPHGRLKGFLKVTRDMTDRKRADDALRETRSFLETLLSSKQTGIAIFDREGRIIRINETLARWRHVDVATATGKPIHELASASAARIEALHRQVVESGKDVLNVELDEEDPQVAGGVRRWLTSFYPVRTPDGVLFGVGAIVSEITEAKRIEDDLKRSEANFRMLAEAIPQMVWSARPDLTLEYCNRRWLDYTGMTPEAAQGTGWLAALHPDDLPHAKTAWRDAGAFHTVSSAENRIRRGDGTYRWHLCRAVPIYGDREELTRWFGTDTDIHDKKEWQEQLSRAKQAAEDASQAKSAFLANMSHEIRTPLGAIVGFSDLLRDESLSRPERLSFIDTIQRNGRDLARLIDDILDLSKVEARRLEVESLDTSLPDLIGEITQSLSIRAREKGISLDVRSVGAIPARIMSDPTRLRQILLNIVGNAIKFTEHGGVTVTVKPMAVGADGRTGVCFLVADTGRGIAPEQAKFLFQPFAQVDMRATRKYGGTGLGLALSKRLAQLLGGDVTLAESTLGKGSTFAISIRANPVTGAPESSEPGPAHDGRGGENGRSNRLRGVHVLVADDVVDNRILIERLLGASGAQVDLVTNGAEAVDRAMKRRYDVVLMDLQMPLLDGIAATQMLRQKGYLGPIVALTAHAQREERERSLRAGCNDHLAKPVNREHLLHVVDRYARH